MVIFSKNIKESQFIFSLIIFFLPKELKGKTEEQHSPGRVVRQGERSTSHSFQPAESIIVSPAGTGELAREQSTAGPPCFEKSLLKLGINVETSCRPKYCRSQSGNKSWSPYPRDKTEAILQLSSLLSLPILPLIPSPAAFLLTVLPPPCP